MEEKEPIAAALRMRPVERRDAGAGRCQNVRIARQRLLGRVANVAQNGEVQIGIDVPQRLDLDMFDEGEGLLHAAENGGNDHHRAGVVRNAGELEARQTSRRDQIADHPLQDLNRQLTGRHDRQDRQPDEHATARPVRIREGLCCGPQHGREERDRA